MRAQVQALLQAQVHPQVLVPERRRALAQAALRAALRRVHRVERLQELQLELRQVVLLEAHLLVGDRLH